jgi:hypothetical protein
MESEPLIAGLGPEYKAIGPFDELSPLEIQVNGHGIARVGEKFLRRKTQEGETVPDSALHR